jgi:hypothetical protein
VRDVSSTIFSVRDTQPPNSCPYPLNMDSFQVDLSGFGFSKAKTHQPVDVNTRKEPPKDGNATTEGPIVQASFTSNRQKKAWGGGSDQSKDRMEVEVSRVSLQVLHDR